MNVSAVGQKRLVIVGATEMVGGYAPRDALEHPAVGRATSFGRRKLGISHPKLTEVLHRDFADCSALTEALSDQDAAIFCLGAYTGAVTRGASHDNVGLHDRVRASSPRQQPRRGFLILERQWRGPNGTKSDALRTLYKERRRRHYSRQSSPAFASSGLRTSTPWSRGRNRISVIACCAGSFRCCSPTT
jgi:hypothetical protein